MKVVALIVVLVGINAAFTLHCACKPGVPAACCKSHGCSTLSCKCH